MKRPQKIIFGEMRATGTRGLLVYCRDYKCSHMMKIAPEKADKWPRMTCGCRSSSRDSSARSAACEALISGVIARRRPHPYRADQLAVLARIARQPGRVQGRSRFSDRTRLAVAPRERHLCEVHTGRLRAVRMTMRSRLSTFFFVLVIAEVGTQ